MDDREVIVNVKCSEPEGEIVRSVRLARLSVERIQFLWEKLKGFDTLFNDFVKDDFAAFVNHFVMEVNGEPVPTGLLWDIDDIGIFLLQDITPHQSATAHFLFWDKRFRGRRQLCIEMLKYAFDNYKFQRIQVEVPLYAYHTMNAVESIGFVLEGRMRKAILWNDKWFDVNLYSVLPSDLDRVAKKKYSVCFKCGQLMKRTHRGVDKKIAEQEVQDGRA